jgi:D-3-phosphoglycerate dehydrogenase / 2-oxoglutarate reductase
MTYKVVTTASLIKTEIEGLSNINAELVKKLSPTEEEIIANASDADAIIPGPTEPFTRRVIESLTNCMVISRPGIGYNNIDVNAATDNGITVACVPDASVSEVSDHTIALLLCLYRRLFLIKEAVSQGAWQRGGAVIPSLTKTITRLNRQTLGIFGLGRIGGTVSKKAGAFDMRVIACDPYITQKAFKEQGAESVDFDRLLSESDYISLHAPLTNETKHAFGLEQFKKMKHSAYLINTARGGLVNESGLVKALNEGYISGAGLDVTEPEPIDPDNPLLKMDNVIITAHTSFYSETSVAELIRRAGEAVIAVLSGKWPEYVVNPEVRDRANCRLK